MNQRGKLQFQRVLCEQIENQNEGATDRHKELLSLTVLEDLIGSEIELLCSYKTGPSVLSKEKLIKSLRNKKDCPQRENASSCCRKSEKTALDKQHKAKKKRQNLRRQRRMLLHSKTTPMP